MVQADVVVRMCIKDTILPAIIVPRRMPRVRRTLNDVQSALVDFSDLGRPDMAFVARPRSARRGCLALFAVMALESIEMVQNERLDANAE